MTNLENDQLQLALRELARITGAVATYLDRAEHLEPVPAATITDAGRRLRTLALGISSEMGINMIDSYGNRLAWLERRSPIGPDVGVDPVGMLRAATTWRDLQLAQIEHDRWYHPDVFGLPRIDQLQHYLLHLAKLTAVLAGLFDPSADWFDFADRRLTDVLIFGVKLTTAAGVQLPDSSIMSPSHPDLVPTRTP